MSHKVDRLADRCYAVLYGDRKMIGRYLAIHAPRTKISQSARVKTKADSDQPDKEAERAKEAIWRLIRWNFETRESGGDYTGITLDEVVASARVDRGLALSVMKELAHPIRHCYRSCKMGDPPV